MIMSTLYQTPDSENVTYACDLLSMVAIDVQEHSTVGNKVTWTRQYLVLLEYSCSV